MSPPAIVPVPSRAEARWRGHAERNHRQRGYASVAWLALLLASGCIIALAWPLLNPTAVPDQALVPQRAAIAPHAGPDDRGAAASTGAQRVPDAEAGQAARAKLEARVDRLEALFPEGLAELERLRREHREAIDQRDRMAALYERVLNESQVMTLDEVESLLDRAARQLDTGVDTAAAMALVEAARARAARADAQSFAPVLASLDGDLQRLREIGERSPRQVATRLAQVLESLPTMPLESEPLAGTNLESVSRAAADASAAGARAAAPDARASESAADASDAASPWWQSIVRRSSGLVDLERVKGDSGELVRVRRIGESDASALPPPARYFIVENLRLRLAGARLSLLLRDVQGFEADRALAEQWMREHFDATAPAVQQGLATLRDLASWRDRVGRPDLERSLAAVAALRERLPASSAAPPAPMRR